MLSAQLKIKPKYNTSKYLLIIVGPTAVGKTALSIDIANYFNAPILSFDSRQFYKELSIGTAKPSVQELNSAKHHFINSHSILTSYTAGKFEIDALSKLESIYKKNDFCIAVGGSGLYIDALVFGIDAMPSDIKIRQKWINTNQKHGLEPLQQFLVANNPEVFNFIDKKNHARMIRAIEVIECSGKKFTDFRKQVAKSRPFTPIWVGLDINRTDLYEKINLRVDKMIEKGLEEEAKGLVSYRNHSALKTVGYTELFDHFEGKIPIEKAIELIKRNSRRYAKRQLTWFSKNESITWFNPDLKGNILRHFQNNILK